jgi:hypothetical protein
VLEPVLVLVLLLLCMYKAQLAGLAVCDIRPLFG